MPSVVCKGEKNRDTAEKHRDAEKKENEAQSTGSKNCNKVQWLATEYLTVLQVHQNGQRRSEEHQGALWCFADGRLKND